MRFKTIIICDSRGRGIEEFIGSHPTPIDHDYIVEVLPGRSIPDIKNIVMDKIARCKEEPYYCVIFAGICGLTEKSDSTSQRSLRYPSENRLSKVTATKDTICDLKSKFTDRINFCTIVPASLKEYFTKFNPGLPVPDYIDSEQLMLEDDIDSINTLIKSLNQPPTVNINLISRFQQKAKKRKQRSNQIGFRKKLRFCTKGLSDGVHFTPEYKSVCFALIIDTSIRDHKTLFHRLQTWPREAGTDALKDSPTRSVFNRLQPWPQKASTSADYTPTQSNSKTVRSVVYKLSSAESSTERKQQSDTTSQEDTDLEDDRDYKRRRSTRTVFKENRV